MNDDQSALLQTVAETALPLLQAMDALSWARQRVDPYAVEQLRDAIKDFVEPLKAALPGFRAAEGANPTIEFRHEDSKGLLIEGSSRVRGIRFLCTGRTEDEFQFLTARNAELLEIVDCTFDDRVLGGQAWAIHGHATDRVVIRSSRFYGKDLVACLLYDSKTPKLARNGNLLMQDCILEAQAILFTRARSSKTEFDITLERNRLRGHTVMGFSMYNDMRPTRITLRENFFQVTSRHINAPRKTAAQIAAMLRWDGASNTYTEGTPFLRLGGPEAANTHFLETLEDFLGSIPGARDPRARYCKPGE